MPPRTAKILHFSTRLLFISKKDLFLLCRSTKQLELLALKIIREMKKFILFVIFLIGIQSINAQDVIVLRDASEIESKVLEIDETNVRYKKWDNPDGPTYIVQRDKILFVRYENGTKEVFNPVETPKETISESHNNERPFVKKGSFQTYISLGYYTGNKDDYVIIIQEDKERLLTSHSTENYSGGSDITVSFGVRINDYAYLGIMTGANLLNFKLFKFPVMVDFRGYFPVNRNIMPFIEVSQGIEGSLVQLCKSSATWGYYDYLGSDKGHIFYSGTVGIGLDATAFSLSMGWYRFAIYNSFYIRVGVNPCWNKILKNRRK